VIINDFATLQQLFAYACKDDRNAIRFCESVWQAFHLWDDIVDGDEPSNVNAGFSGITSEMLANPFAVAHSGIFAGTLALIISNWDAANQFERSKQHIEKAYMLRAQLYNLPVQCAFIIGGQEWANHIALVSWSSYGEVLEQFKQEVENA
jgi:hypothetical protein